jgi:hypothetical protein
MKSDAPITQQAYMAGFFEGVRMRKYSSKWFVLGRKATAMREAYLMGHKDGWNARQRAERFSGALYGKKPEVEETR